MGANAIDILESCYRTDLDDPQWLNEIAEHVSRAAGSPLGALAYLRDGGESSRRGVLGCSRSFDPRWLETFASGYVDHHVPAQGRSRDPLVVTAEALAPILAGRTCTVSAVASLAPLLPLLSIFGGAADLLTLNGYDPTGSGVSVTVPLPRRTSVPRRADLVFQRITTHLAAAHRLRRRLMRDEPPAAVLSPAGELVHAEGAEEEAARAALRTGARQLELARSRAMRGVPERATALWKGLVSARWTLLDEFSADGKHFIVARRNDVQLPLEGPTLTWRERQVLAHAALDRSNKEIAYELGLAHSTVRVLLLRAAARLGTKGRTATIMRFRALLAGREATPHPEAEVTDA